MSTRTTEVAISKHYGGNYVTMSTTVYYSFNVQFCRKWRFPTTLQNR